MQNFVSTAGIAGFVIVFGLSIANGNDPGRAVIHSLLAALAFAILIRSFMRKAYTQLHYSLYEKQLAAAQEAAETAEAEAAEKAAREAEAVPVAEEPEALPAEPATVPVA
jgi:hypothetical protein